VRETERCLPPMRICIKMQKPSAAEIATNPRARSAILRVAERIG
jgi:16S rRNA (cytosine1402-N4)-methyltransferase